LKNDFLFFFGFENVHVITVLLLLRKWCHNNKHFSELAPRSWVFDGKNSWHLYYY